MDLREGVDRQSALIEQVEAWRAPRRTLAPADVDVVMVAPRMIGVGVRDTYRAGAGAPELVVFTGDLAFSGRAEEYEKVARFMEWLDGETRTQQTTTDVAFRLALC